MPRQTCFASRCSILAALVLSSTMVLACDPRDEPFGGDSATPRIAVEALVCEPLWEVDAEGYAPEPAAAPDAGVLVDGCDDRLDDCIAQGGTPSPPNMSLECSFTTDSVPVSWRRVGEGRPSSPWTKIIASAASRTATARSSSSRA